MRPSYRLLFALAAALTSAQAPLVAQAAPAAASVTLPSKIPDAEYWKTINDLAEPGG